MIASCLFWHPPFWESKCDIILWQLHPMWKCSHPPFIMAAGRCGPWPRSWWCQRSGSPRSHRRWQPVQRDRPVMWLKNVKKTKYTTTQWTTIMTIYQKIRKTTIKRLSIVFPSLPGPFTPHYPTMGSNPDLTRKNGVQNYHHSSFVGGSYFFKLYMLCIYGGKSK